MIYRSNDIPEGYNKIAEISDNYLVWVRESTLQSGTSYSAYIQYLSPSVYCVLIDNYKIKCGTSHSVVANYDANGILTDYDIDYSLATMSVSSEDIVTDDFSRGDFPVIFIGQFLCCVFFVWMLNQLSKLFKKDGVFH